MQQSRLHDLPEKVNGQCTCYRWMVDASIPNVVKVNR